MSKRKKNKPRSSRKGGPKKRPEHEVHAPPSTDDEIIHVPKGHSRLRFFLILGLTIFILLVFTIPDQLMNVVGGNQGTQKVLTWNHPSEGTQVVDAVEFDRMRREISDFYAVAGVRAPNLTDDDVIEMICFQGLAEASGIGITDADMAGAILEGFQNQTPRFGNEETYRLLLERTGVSPKNYEATLRRYMRIIRFQDMLRIAAGLAEPAEMERIWKEAHREYAFDYAAIEIESLMDDPALAVPAEDELETWFGQQTEQFLAGNLRDEFTDPSIRAEIVAYTIGGEEPTGLLEKFPRPEGTDMTELARNYHVQNSHIRFRRPESDADSASDPEGTDDDPEGTDEDPEGTDGGEPGGGLYYTFEEVTEAALREAPVFHALQDWKRDVEERIFLGANIDLEAEALELGLTFQPGDLARSREEWQAAEPFGGAFLANAVSLGSVDRLSTELVMEEGAMMVGRVLEREDARPPTFTEAKERIGEEWQKAKAAELALERLQVVHDGFTVRPPAEVLPPDAEWAPGAGHDEFVQACEDAGLEPSRLDWYDRSDPTLFSRVGEQPELIFFQTNPELFELESDGLAAPKADLSGNSIYLVRAEGARDPAGLSIDPREFDDLRLQAELETFRKFFERTIQSRDFWEQQYGLELATADPVEDPGS